MKTRRGFIATLFTAIGLLAVKVEAKEPELSLDEHNARQIEKYERFFLVVEPNGQWRIFGYGPEKKPPTKRNRNDIKPFAFLQ